MVSNMSTVPNRLGPELLGESKGAAEEGREGGEGE